MPEQGLSPWHPNAKAAMRKDNTEYLYPEQSTCWACGAVQIVTDQTAGMRRCRGTEDAPHEEVTWKDELITRQLPAVEQGSQTTYGELGRPWNQFIRRIQPRRDGD